MGLDLLRDEERWKYQRGEQAQRFYTERCMLSVRPRAAPDAMLRGAYMPGSRRQLKKSGVGLARFDFRPKITGNRLSGVNPEVWNIVVSWLCLHLSGCSFFFPQGLMHHYTQSEQVRRFYTERCMLSVGPRAAPDCQT